MSAVMRFWLVAAIFCIFLLPRPASASDRPAVGPVPAWVEPIALPRAPAPTSDVPVRILLNDEQVYVENGRKSVYVRFAVRVETPQGLAVGNLSFPWRPETDTPVVHSLLIRRGDQVIDVLASGQTFTVLRRETNLERATLDGVLTASIQPEGLQVGDIIDFALTIETGDPVFNGHVEHVGADANGLPIDLVRFRMSWPDAIDMRLRGAGDIVVPPVRTSGNRRSIEIVQRDLAVLTAPNGAPQRYQAGRYIEATDYANWEPLGTLMTPLYETAATLRDDSAIHAEIERIRAQTESPRERAEAVLTLVQDRVRYVALAMGEGGYVPATADETWARRYGDCKAKTALLLAMLRPLGIDAEPVLANIDGRDGLPDLLPRVGQFNHVLVRATIDGRTYWFDGTRTGDRKLDTIETPPFRWGLPVLTAGSALVPIEPAPSATPATRTTFTIDASDGLFAPARVKVDVALSGDAAIQANTGIAAVPASRLDAIWEQFWTARAWGATITETHFTFDADNKRLVISGTGTQALGWNGLAYRPPGANIGYQADFTRPEEQDQTAPFAVDFPFYVVTETDIILPQGAGTFQMVGDSLIETTVAGVSYRREARLEGNRFHLVNETRSIAREFPASEAVAAQAAIRALDDKNLYLRAPGGYQLSDRDRSTTDDAAQPMTAAALVERAVRFASSRIYPAAAADLDRALSLEPQNATIRAARALLQLEQNDLVAAQAEIDAGMALDPQNMRVLSATARVAMARSRPADAVTMLTRMLEIEPNAGSIVYPQRAQAYRALNDPVHELADIDSALAINAQNEDLYLARFNALKRLDRSDEALKVADDLVAAMPDSNYAWVIAARIHGRLGERDAAMAAFARAITIKPEAYIYINRAQSRPLDDVAARMADIDLALQLEPDNNEALAERARLQTVSGDPFGAAMTLTTALSSEPDDSVLLNQRGIAYARANRTALAERDFAAARSHASTSFDLNELCWAKVLANVALETALNECSAALALAPNAANIIDSRAWVYLRMGRHDEAIEEFTRALAKEPQQAASIYGRAIAWLRIGQQARADADRAAAVAIYPEVADEFDRNGIRFVAVEAGAGPVTPAPAPGGASPS